MTKRKSLVGCCIIFLIFRLGLRYKKDPFDIDFIFDWYFLIEDFKCNITLLLDQESANIPLK